MPKQPTPMQAKALELIKEGKTPTQAMREAGYSEETASAPKRNLLSTPGAQALIEQYRAEYAAQGIIPEYYTKRVKDLIEAEKIHSSHTEPDRLVPDWTARAKGLEIFRKDVGLDQDVTINQTNVGEMNIEFS